MHWVLAHLLLRRHAGSLHVSLTHPIYLGHESSHLHAHIHIDRHIHPDRHADKPVDIYVDGQAVHVILRIYTVTVTDTVNRLDKR